MQQRFFSGEVEPLGDREIGVIAATSKLARDGNILEISGMDLSNYRKVPIVLYQHDRMQPVGIATALGVVGDSLAARIRFADAGVSVVSDQACALCKAGILRGISIGFDPDWSTAEPIDPKNPRGGKRFRKSELLEISVVSIPADTGATVVARSFGGREDFRRMIERLPAMAKPSLERAAAKLPQHAGGRILSHAGHVWTLLQISEQKRQAYSREARQSDLEARRPPGAAVIPRRRKHHSVKGITGAF